MIGNASKMNTDLESRDIIITLTNEICHSDVTADKIICVEGSDFVWHAMVVIIKTAFSN